MENNCIVQCVGSTYFSVCTPSRNSVCVLKGKRVDLRVVDTEAHQMYGLL